MFLPDAGRLPIPQAAAHMEHYQVLDSTKLQCYQACPRQYFFEYVLGWRADRQSNHLVFGQAWHSALEHIYKNGMKPESIYDGFQEFLKVYRQEFPDNTDEWFGGKSPAAALQGLIEYANQNVEDVYRYKVLATEVSDNLPITEQDSIVVKLDAVLQNVDTGRITIMEHKTGSAAGQWWARQWHLSLQVGAYIAACNHFYEVEDTPCIVDGTFFLKTKRTFQRELVMRSQESLLNWANTVLSLINRIERDFEILADEDGESCRTQKSFPQNPGACSNYGGCQFHDLCTCVANPVEAAANGRMPGGFKEYWWEPDKQGE